MAKWLPSLVLPGLEDEQNVKFAVADWLFGGKRKRFGHEQRHVRRHSQERLLV